MTIGLVLALLSMVSTGFASVIEAIGARRATAAPGGSETMATLRNPIYLSGLGVDLLGFVAAVAAMQHLPMFVVQAAVAGSVGVTALVVAKLGTPLTRVSIAALVAMIMGLALLAVSAAPEGVQPLPTFWAWMLVLAGLPIALLGLFCLRTSGRTRQISLAVVSGVAFTVVAIAARTLDLPDGLGGWFISPNILAIVVNGLIGTACFAAALEHGSVTTTAAVMFTTETVLPSVIGLTLLDDDVRAGFLPLAALGFGLAVGGAVLLARYSSLPARSPALAAVPAAPPAPA